MGAGFLCHLQNPGIHQEGLIGYCDLKSDFKQNDGMGTIL